MTDITPTLTKVEYGAFGAPGLTKYDVFLGEVRIGRVYSVFETIEKRIAGKRYVAWRRPAKTPSWRFEIDGNPGRWIGATSRKAAIEGLVQKHLASNA